MPILNVFRFFEMNNDLENFSVSIFPFQDKFKILQRHLIQTMQNRILQDRLDLIF